MVRFWVFIFLFFPITIFANANGGLDVVIIIDQSGSMYGYTDGSIQNDPHNERIRVTEEIIEKLAEKTQDSNNINRISVLEYGGDTWKPRWKKQFKTQKDKYGTLWGDKDVRVLLSDCELSFNPIRKDQVIFDAKQCIANAKLDGKHLNNTNTPKVLLSAKKQFDLLSQNSPPNNQREKKLLLITDGRPDISERKGNKEISLSILRQQIRDTNEDLKKLGVDFRILAINDKKSNYWYTGVNGISDGEFWQDLTGKDSEGEDKAKLFDYASQLSNEIEKIVNSWLGTQTVTSNCIVPTQSINIRSYLAKSTIDINFSQANNALYLVYPNNNKRRKLSAKNPSVTLDQPISGVYRFENLDPNTTTHYCATHQDELPTVSLYTPLTNQHVGDKSKLRFQLEKTQNDPRWNIKDNVKASAIIIAPNGIETTVKAHYDSVQNIFISENWTPQQRGIHNVRFEGFLTIKIQTKQGTQNQSVPFLAQQATHIVGNISVGKKKNNLLLNFEQPKSDGELKANIIPWIDQSIPIKMALHDKGKNTEIKQYFSPNNQLDDYLTIELMDKKSNKPLSDTPIKVKYTDNRFIADIPIPPLDYVLGEGILSPHKLHLRINAKDWELNNNAHLVGIHLSKALNNQRISGDGFTVSDIEIGASMYFLIFALIAIIIFFLLLGWVIFKWIVPWLIIRSEDRNSTLQLKIYNIKQDPTGSMPIVRGGCFDISKKTKDNLTNKILLSDGNDLYKPSKFIVKRNMSQGKYASVTIKYSWKNDIRKEQHEMDLKTGKLKPLKRFKVEDYRIRLERTKGASK